jgi:hypothetical protein
VDADSSRGTLLTRCLRLNALALAFSLSHTIADIALFAFGPGISEGVSMAIVAAASAIYGWWGWSMAQAARDGRAGQASLLVLCGFWAVAQGVTFVFIPLTEYVADVIHFGSLIFGAWGAYATWRLLRARRVTLAAGLDPVRRTLL